jgi:hypothetical protein
LFLPALAPPVPTTLPATGATSERKRSEARPSSLSQIGSAAPERLGGRDPRLQDRRSRGCRRSRRTAKPARSRPARAPSALQSADRSWRLCGSPPAPKGRGTANRRGPAERRPAARSRGRRLRFRSRDQVQHRGAVVCKLRRRCRCQPRRLQVARPVLLNARSQIRWPAATRTRTELRRSCALEQVPVAAKIGEAGSARAAATVVSAASTGARRPDTQAPISRRSA